MRHLFSILIFVCIASGVLAQTSGVPLPGAGPKVLLVTSHPDDETVFPVTVYKITQELNGTADLALLTDGQGGYQNTEFGSRYYGLNLLDSTIGRAYLPAIRKRELLNSGKILGIRNFYFFDQKDDFYSQNPQPYVSGAKWDVPLIEKKLDQILSRTAYDYVLILLPHAEQHGHHKTSGIMALRAVKRLPVDKRPIVLGGELLNKADISAFHFEELSGFPETKIRKGAPVFTFDRTVRFGNFNLMSYMVVADWVISEYKSQGDTQNNYMHKYDLETFWYFDLNGEAGVGKVKKLFDQLKASGFRTDGAH